MIEFKNISKSYGNQEIIKDLSIAHILKIATEYYSTGTASQLVPFN